MKLRIFANIFVLVIGVGLAIYFDHRIETVSAGQAQNTHYLSESMEAVTQNLEAIFELKKAATIEDVQVLTVTAHTPSVDETDSDPMITASMEQVRPGCIPVSRDLFADGWVVTADMNHYILVVLKSVEFHEIREGSLLPVLNPEKKYQNEPQEKKISRKPLVLI